MKEALLQCQAGPISSNISKFWQKAAIRYLVGEYPQPSQGITNKKPTCKGKPRINTRWGNNHKKKHFHNAVYDMATEPSSKTCRP